MAEKKEYKSGNRIYYIDKYGQKTKRKNKDKVNNEYKARTYQRVTIIVRKDDEKDVIDKLESVESKTQYNINLIRKDIDASK